MAAEYIRLGYIVIEFAASLLAVASMAGAIYMALKNENGHAMMCLVAAVVNFGTILVARALQ